MAGSQCSETVNSATHVASIATVHDTEARNVHRVAARRDVHAELYADVHADVHADAPNRSRGIRASNALKETPARLRVRCLPLSSAFSFGR